MKTSSKRDAADTAKAEAREVPVIRRKELEQTIQELLTQPSPVLLMARIETEYGAKLHALKEAGYAAQDVAQHYVEKLPKCTTRMKKTIKAIFEQLFTDLESGNWRPVSAAANQQEQQQTNSGDTPEVGLESEAANETAAIEREDQHKTPSGHREGPDDEPDELETLEKQLVRNLEPRDDETNAERPPVDQGDDK